jgi:hypothetical protein
VPVPSARYHGVRQPPDVGFRAARSPLIEQAA